MLVIPLQHHFYQDPFRTPPLQRPWVTVTKTKKLINAFACIMHLEEYALTENCNYHSYFIRAEELLYTAPILHRKSTVIALKNKIKCQ